MRITTLKVFGTLAIALTLSACAGGGWLFINSPPTYGAELRLDPGFTLGSGATTLHPTAAYGWHLAGGEDLESGQVFHLGAQVRRTLPGCAGTAKCLWLGAEATYARRWATFDEPGIDDETENGWTLAGLAGVPVYRSEAGTLHAYTAAGVNKFGGSGLYARLGLDFQPAFLNR